MALSTAIATDRGLTPCSENAVEPLENAPAA